MLWALELERHAAVRRRRAMTLVETLVAASLALLLGVVALQVLAPLMRTSARTAQRMELQQQALVALQRMAADLASTTYSGVSLRTRPGVLAVVPLRTVAADGTPVWDNHLIIYTQQGGRLLRRLHEPSAGGRTGLVLDGHAPARVDPEILEELARPVGGEQVLADHVAAFEVQGTGSSLLDAAPITLRLVLEKTSPARKEAERFELSRTVICKQPL